VGSNNGYAPMKLDFGSLHFEFEDCGRADMHNRRMFNEEQNQLEG